MSQSFTTVDDSVLCSAIDKAAERVVFVAPGVTDSISKALAVAWQRLGHANVTIVLDVDPAVCRLGYGTLEGLEALQKTATSQGSMICHQPGLRIGILICDGTTLVYTPTPLLIEPGAPPKSASTGQMELGSSKPASPSRPNGIVLSTPPPALADDLGIGSSGAATQQIGLDKVPETQVKALAQDLKTNPPLPFDIARPVLVFNSQIEFVEFNLEKIQLQRQEIPIPSEVMGLAAKNIHGLFRLDPGKGLVEAKENLEKIKREIDKQYTRPSRGFGGSLIRRADKEKFLAAVAGLESKLNEFRRYVCMVFEQIAEKNKQELITNLLPAIKRTPPDACRQFVGAKDEEPRLRQWLMEQLHEPFAKVARGVEDMRVTVRFKGVTFECLKDPEFIDRAQEAFPDLQLHEEFTAAPEKPKR